MHCSCSLYVHDIIMIHPTNSVHASLGMRTLWNCDCCSSFMQNTQLDNHLKVGNTCRFTSDPAKQNVFKKIELFQVISVISHAFTIPFFWPDASLCET